MGWELAQLNLARPLEPLDSPRLADFVANLERINALAESSDGFAWRLKDEAGEAEAARVFPGALVNLSVWRDLESLRLFVYQSAHVEIMRRRREWFEKMAEAMVVLWWVPAGHRPDAAEAEARLLHLRQHGPTAVAFTFQKAFEPAASPRPQPAEPLPR